MIIGNGLIANEFKKTSLYSNTEAVIYAKGVSDSTCTEDYEFSRDYKELYDYITCKKESITFYYISTCSVYSKKSSMYISHKLRCEELITGYQNTYIVRLPQIAGRKINNNNLCGYIYNCILCGEGMRIFNNAKRNIIDIDDVKCVLVHIIDKKIKMPQVFNIATPEDVDINDFIESLEIYMGRVLKKIHVENTECNYKININDVEQIYRNLNMNFGKHYALDTFIKNYLINIPEFKEN